MIENLIIKNLFLIEELSLKFNKGFTVFTGETGSGKSAILNSIRLLLGEKTDATFLRKGSDLGVAIATFSEFNREKLASKGIQVDEGEFLIIQREIHSNGKSKASINNQPVSLSLLKELGKELIEIADQGASMILKDEALHQRYYDLFAGIDLTSASSVFSELEDLKKRSRELITQLNQKEREVVNLEREITEIETHFLTEEQEKSLFEEFSLLTNANVRKELIERFLEEFPSLKPSHQLLQKISHLDPILQKESDALYERILELSEITHTLNQHLNRVEASPEKIESIDEKLSNFSRLKKRFGKTSEEIGEALQSSKERLEELLNLDDEIEQLEKEIRKKELLCNALFKEITAARHSSKEAFQSLIEQELKTLNIPSARFSVEIESKERSILGDESIYFLMAPNIGEKLIRVKDQISGGEMARLLLTLLTLLASKEKKPLIVFDEIDANIGGQTALAIGQKFLKLAESRQVIAITHFPQVAVAANHHFLIDKINQNLRTHTTVQKLDPKAIKLELSRMRGES